jgi:hypothetical protein
MGSHLPKYLISLALPCYCHFREWFGSSALEPLRCGHVAKTGHVSRLQRLQCTGALEASRIRHFKLQVWLYIYFTTNNRHGPKTNNMIFSCPFFTTSMAILFAIFLSIFFLLWISRRALLQRTTSKRKVPPEAGGAWPLIGHLHLLAGTKPAHITLGNMADKYGPIFTIWFGVHRTLVVSSWEIAKECFTTNDKAFATRPKGVALEVLG